MTAQVFRIGTAEDATNLQLPYALLLVDAVVGEADANQLRHARIASADDVGIVRSLEDEILAAQARRDGHEGGRVRRVNDTDSIAVMPSGRCNYVKVVTGRTTEFKQLDDLVSQECTLQLLARPMYVSYWPAPDLQGRVKWEVDAVVVKGE